MDSPTTTATSPHRPTPLPQVATTAFHQRASSEQSLTSALALFQAKVQPVRALDPAAVMEAARQAFDLGIAHTSSLLWDEGRRKLRVSLMHVGGAELHSEEWLSPEHDAHRQAASMLAMLLGIPLTTLPCPAEGEDLSVSASACKSKPAHEAAAPGPQAQQATAVIELEAAAPLTATQPGDPGEGSDLLEPEAIADYHQKVLALTPDARRSLTTAFREHFGVPKTARSISDRITQRQHGVFIDCFLDELQVA